MSKQTWNGGALLAPVPPALVTVGDMEKHNVLTIGWTGILNTKPPKTYISVRPERFSYPIIKETGEFVINLPSASLAKKVDFCGIYTGAKLDKFEKCGFTKLESKEVSAPTVAECPISLECRVCDIVPLGTHDMFIADILSVSVDDSLLDKSGRLCIEKADLCAFAHGEYFKLGAKLGKMGFSTDKSKKRSNKNKS